MAKQGQNSGGRAVASASAAGRWRRRQRQGVGVHVHRTRQGGDGLSGQQDVGGCYFWLRQQGVSGNRAIEKNKFYRLQGGRQGVGSWLHQQGRSATYQRRRRRYRRTQDVGFVQRAASSGQPCSVVGRTDHTLGAARQLVGDVSAQTGRCIGVDRLQMWNLETYRRRSTGRCIVVPSGFVSSGRRRRAS